MTVLPVSKDTSKIISDPQQIRILLTVVYNKREHIKILKAIKLHNAIKRAYVSATERDVGIY